MRPVKRRLTILVLVLAVGLAGFLFLNRQSGEPLYQGKSLSYWFQRYCLEPPHAGGYPTDANEALDAVQKIAPDARVVIPILLEKVADRRSSQGDRFNAAVTAVRVDPSNSTALATLTGFVQSKSLFRRVAIEVLGEAGPGASPAVPILKEALNDRDKLVRQSAAGALRKIEGEKTP
jgi:hypothetical protein